MFFKEYCEDFVYIYPKAGMVGVVEKNTVSHVPQACKPPYILLPFEVLGKEETPRFQRSIVTHKCLLRSG